MRNAKAFTIIELLVVIGLIIVILAILLPSVQYARTAAGRLKCQSNFRQIGVAVESYAITHRMYPSPWLCSGPNWSANNHSIHSYILPYLDESNVFQMIEFDGETGFMDAGSQTVRQIVINGFLCPTGLQEKQRNSIRFNAGLYHNAAGPFRPFSPVRRADLGDRSARIAFASELVGGSFSTTEYSSYRDIAVTGPSTTPPVSSIPVAASVAVSACRDLAGLSPKFTESGRDWYFNGFYNTLYQHSNPPNSAEMACDFSPIWEGGGGTVGPRSMHGSGVNVLYGDGHIEFVSNDIDRIVWIKLGALHPEEIVF